jgi:hypothetical protein
LKRVYLMPLCRYPQDGPRPRPGPAIGRLSACRFWASSAFPNRTPGQAAPARAPANGAGPTQTTAGGNAQRGDCKRKQFFFEKKNQKTFAFLGDVPIGQAASPNNQKFFVSFFQKRNSSFLL